MTTNGRSGTRARMTVVVITAALAATLIGASPATAAKPSFAKTVAKVLQKTHAPAGVGAMRSDSCLNRLARKTAARAVKSHRTPSRGSLQRKANRSCKVTGAAVRTTKAKSARRAAKTLRSGLRRHLVRPSTNRLGIATKRAHGRRVTVALVASRVPGSSSTSPTPAPVVPADFLPRARAEFVRLVNVERTNAGLQPVRANVCLDGVAQPWADHIAAAHTMDHNVGADGKAGYERCSPIAPAQLKYSAFNEIIAQVTQRQAQTPEGLAVAAVAAFNGSSRHRARMMVPSVTELGTGIAFDSGVGYWKLVGELADYSPR
jgi:uncharacterized protein YkwD